MKIFGIVLASIVGFAALCFLVFLALIRPSSKKRDIMERYKGVKFAHRGLHDGEKAENSLSAFAAAVECGYAIELDVRLSKDGELVVFHDDTVDRMTEARGRVDSFTADELAKMHLGGTEDGVPTNFVGTVELQAGQTIYFIYNAAKNAEGEYTFDLDDFDFEEEGVYKVKAPRPVAAGGSTYITGRKAEAEKKAAELAARKEQEAKWAAHAKKGKGKKKK